MAKLAQINIGEELWLKPEQGIAGVPAFQSLGGFISALLPNVYVIASVLLFILLLAGGIMIIASAGKGEQEGTKKGAQAITAAFVGFLIIFISYWIIQIIQVVTGIEIFTSSEI
jgi:uncharacterized membrane protein YozB (DUF420 family)